jgi:hypothetical protein
MSQFNKQIPCTILRGTRVLRGLVPALSLLTVLTSCANIDKLADSRGVNDKPAVRIDDGPLIVHGAPGYPPVLSLSGATKVIFRPPRAISILPGKKPVRLSAGSAPVGGDPDFAANAYPYHGEVELHIDSTEEVRFPMDRFFLIDECSGQRFNVSSYSIARCSRASQKKCLHLGGPAWMAKEKTFPPGLTTLHLTLDNGSRWQPLRRYTVSSAPWVVGGRTIRFPDIKLFEVEVREIQGRDMVLLGDCDAMLVHSPYRE